jgi:hypothetical protein
VKASLLSCREKRDVGYAMCDINGRLLPAPSSSNHEEDEEKREHKKRSGFNMPYSKVDTRPAFL